MKINNKQILAILSVAFVVLAAFYAYSVKGVITQGEVSGYLSLIDQKITLDDYAALREKTFYTIIYLPNENCEGIVNYCSYEFKAGVDSRADLNNDGKIDGTDAQILAESFYCSSGQKCWDQPIERCYFSFSGRKFRDPTYDCVVNQSDTAIITNTFGTKDISSSCDVSVPPSDACKADINKDSIVDLMDAVILSINYGKYADSFVRLIERKSQADINKDGTVELMDAIKISNNYGQEAIEQKCTSAPLTHISDKKYGVSATGRGLYYAGVSYTCKL